MIGGFDIECPRINFSSLDGAGFEWFQKFFLLPFVLPVSNHATPRITNQGNVRFPDPLEVFDPVPGQIPLVETGVPVQSPRKEARRSRLLHPSGGKHGDSKDVSAKAGRR
jgi:hypothetical protein